MCCCTVSFAQLNVARRENLHRAVPIILDGLDFNLSSPHCGDAPSLRKVRGFYEWIQLLGLCGELGRKGCCGLVGERLKLSLAAGGINVGARSQRSNRLLLYETRIQRLRRVVSRRWARGEGMKAERAVGDWGVDVVN